MVYRFNNSLLIKLVENLINDLKRKFSDLVNSEFSEEWRRGKLKKVKISYEKYTKKLNDYILLGALLI